MKEEINLWIEANEKRITVDEFETKTGQDFGLFFKLNKKDVLKAIREKNGVKEPQKREIKPMNIREEENYDDFDPLSLLITQNRDLRVAADYGAKQERKRIIRLLTN